MVPANLSQLTDKWIIFHKQQSMHGHSSDSSLFRETKVVAELKAIEKRGRKDLQVQKFLLLFWKGKKI